MYVASNWAGYATSRRSTSEMALYFLGLRRRSHFPAERLTQNSTQQHLECGKACRFESRLPNLAAPILCYFCPNQGTSHWDSALPFLPRISPLQTRAGNLVETVTSQSHRILHFDLLMVLDCNFVDWWAILRLQRSWRFLFTLSVLVGWKFNLNFFEDCLTSTSDVLPSFFLIKT